MTSHAPSLQRSGVGGAPQWVPANGAQLGEVFTRRWVVELILDLAGYEADLVLSDQLIVEPSCGQGAFLIPIVDRLVASCELHGTPLADAGQAITAYELQAPVAAVARARVAEHLCASGHDERVARDLAHEWVRCDDFLLSDLAQSSADFVVGNPPYIRLEEIPPEVASQYRERCSTMRGRADVYVGFFERGLKMLRPEGKLAFICADRWMRNQYGGHLRQLISDSFSVDTVIAMHDVDVFDEAVDAYPAITILRRGSQGRSKVVEARASFDSATGDSVVDWVRGEASVTDSPTAVSVVDLPGWFEGAGLWPSGSPKELALIADLERRFAPLENTDTGTRVGIGVASGCDEVFVVADAPEVENGRLLPLAMARDTSTGVVAWGGRYLVNPWVDGQLVELSDYPGLESYLGRNSDRLRQRHIARRRPASWFRTIDRVDPELRTTPKLLFPDMKAAAHPVLDRGKFYPHHNLYYVVSTAWDLEVLGGLLLSDIANLFVGAYCVKMRGGTYRFQAQYLRKIRVPDPASISLRDQADLRAAFRARDRAGATEVALRVYELPPDAIARDEMPASGGPDVQVAG